MKKSLFTITLILSGLLFLNMSCKRDPEPDPEPTPNPIHIVPPGEGGTLPSVIIPDSLVGPIEDYFTVYEGLTPPSFDGQFVSHPHMLLHSTFEDDTITVFNDRYIAFFVNGDRVDFYGKQWDDEENAYYEEAYRNLYVIGTGEGFCTYYYTDGYPNGMYAKQSTVFSGKWNAAYGGLKDFQVAVILLETSGNPNLAPAGSFRVLGDGEGLARDTTWFSGKDASFGTVKVSDEDAFHMFRVR